MQTNGLKPSKHFEPNRLPVQVLHSSFEGGHYRILAETLNGQKFSFLHRYSLESGTFGWILIPKQVTFLYPHKEER